MIECRDVRQLLWAGDAVPAVASIHIDSCPNCRVEARRAGQLVTILANLQHDLAVPPPELQRSLITATPRSRTERAREMLSHPKFWRGAAVGAVAASVAAVGLVVARRLARPGVAA